MKLFRLVGALGLALMGNSLNAQTSASGKPDGVPVSDPSPVIPVQTPAGKPDNKPDKGDKNKPNPSDRPERPDHPDKPANANPPESVKKMIDDFKAAQAKFLQEQRDLQDKMKEGSKEQKDQIRQQLRDKRDQFLEQQKEMREEIRKRVTELKEQLKDHRDLLDDVKDKANKPRKGGDN